MLTQGEIFEKLKLAVDSFSKDDVLETLKICDRIQSDQFLLFLIYKCLPFPGGSVRKATLELLKKHVDRIVDPLVAVLNHPEYKAREVVFTLLGDSGKLNVEQLKMILEKPEKDDIKIKAVDYMLELQGAKSYDFLVRQMVNPGFALRRHLNKILVEKGEALVQPIKDVFSDGNLHQKYWALKLLIDISGPKAFKQIRKLLISKDPSVRLYAMAALEYLPGDQALGMLFAGMLEQSPLMRYQASYVLGRRGEETLRQAFSLMKIKGPELKDEMIVIIGKILGNKSREFFKKMLVSKSSDERYYALKAVAQNPDREGVRVLIDALADPVWIIRHMVCSMLSHVIPIARDELIRALDSDDLDKVYWVSKALGEGRDPLSARPLMNLVDHHKDSNARVWAVRALGQLDLEYLVDMLILSFGDDALSVRNEILSALSSMTPEKVIKPLLIQLFSGNKALSFWCEKTLKNLKFSSFSSVLQMLVTLDSKGLDRFISYLHQLKPHQIVAILEKKEVKLEDFDPDEIVEDDHIIMPLSEYRSVDDLLAQLKEMKGSDLHLNVGLPPMFRIHGELIRTHLPSIDEERAMQLFSILLNEEQRARFEKDWEIDFSHEVKHIGRFRANIFRQRYGLSGIFRLIPSIVPSFEELGLPRNIFENLCDNRQGLILVTGPTGSGKSTTMAAMVDEINRKRFEHVLTIEDPIEFVHFHKRCSINQRELGTHTHSFAQALRSALREDPDVILVGEMRDPETIKLALTAAETGHLVFSTLHTISAGESINRIVGAFSAEYQEQVRLELSGVLRGIVSQKLLQRADKKGRVLAYELLMINHAVKNLIKEAKTEQLASVMQTSSKEHMQTMDQSLARLIKLNRINLETALPHVADKPGFRNLLKPPEEKPTMASHLK